MILVMISVCANLLLQFVIQMVNSIYQFLSQFNSTITFEQVYLNSLKDDMFRSAMKQNVFGLYHLINNLRILHS